MLNIAPRSEKATLAGWWLEVEGFRKMHGRCKTTAMAGRESEETDGLGRSFVLLIRTWNLCASQSGSGGFASPCQVRCSPNASERGGFQTAELGLSRAPAFD